MPESENTQKPCPRCGFPLGMTAPICKNCGRISWWTLATEIIILPGVLLALILLLANTSADALAQCAAFIIFVLILKILVDLFDIGNYFYKRRAQKSGAGGANLGESLMRLEAICPRCDQPVAFEQGVQLARKLGIKDNVVVCPSCLAIYTVEMTPRQMKLVQDVTNQYAGTMKK